MERFVHDLGKYYTLDYSVYIDGRFDMLHFKTRLLIHQWAEVVFIFQINGHTSLKVTFFWNPSKQPMGKKGHSSMS